MQVLGYEPLQYIFCRVVLLEGELTGSVSKGGGDYLCKSYKWEVFILKPVVKYESWIMCINMRQSIITWERNCQKSEFPGPADSEGVSRSVFFFSVFSTGSRSIGPNPGQIQQFNRCNRYKYRWNFITLLQSAHLQWMAW